MFLFPLVRVRNRNEQKIYENFIGNWTNGTQRKKKLFAWGFFYYIYVYIFYSLLLVQCLCSRFLDSNFSFVSLCFLHSFRYTIFASNNGYSWGQSIRDWKITEPLNWRNSISQANARTHTNTRTQEVVERIKYELLLHSRSMTNIWKWLHL